MQILERSFRIAAPDHVLAALAPELLPRLAAAAPGVNVELRGLPSELPRAAAPADVGGGGVYLSTEPPEDPMLVHARLYVDELVLLAPPHHSSLRSGNPPRIDLDGLLSARHVDLVGKQGTAHHLDAALTAAGVTRRVAVRVRSALLAAQLVPGTDRIALLPHGFARRVASQLDLRVADAPLELEPIEVTMIWHPAHQDDPAHAWFRSRLQESGRRLDHRQHDARFGPR